jgi:ankyrin repeat protein
MHGGTPTGCRSLANVELDPMHVIPENLPTPVLPLLLFAAASPSTEELERVLCITPDVNVIENGTQQRNALHMAAIFNQPRNISLLLRAGVNRHAVTDKGFSPLVAACISGSAEAVKVLLDEGDQDPNSRDSYQNTPLHAAVMNGHVGVIRELLEHGADPSATTVDGWTPLTAALFKKNSEVTEILTQAIASYRDSKATGEQGG